MILSLSCGVLSKSNIKDPVHGLHCPVCPDNGWHEFWIRDARGQVDVKPNGTNDLNQFQIVSTCNLGALGPVLKPNLRRDHFFET